MKYAKPELLTAEAALAAIRGWKDVTLGFDSEVMTDPRTDAPAYGMDE